MHVYSETVHKTVFIQGCCNFYTGSREYPCWLAGMYTCWRAWVGIGVVWVAEGVIWVLAGPVLVQLELMLECPLGIWAHSGVMYTNIKQYC
jgi:hypothetical protein